MTGRLKDISMNLDGSQDLRITFNADLGEMFYELYGKDVNVEIKRIYKRRSLDANALCWYIIDKIAEKMKVKKSEVYRNAIRDIGGVSDIVCVRDFAVDKLTRGWSEHGEGWQTEVTKSKIPGCSNVTLYYGSSVYDSKQMTALIDSLMQDAEALGISTPAQSEIERSLELWGQKKKEGQSDVPGNESDDDFGNDSGDEQPDEQQAEQVPEEEAAQEDDEESLY